MPQYWVIAPVESKEPELFDRVWQFDLANNLISIGWTKLGDVSKMSRPELSSAVGATYPDKPPQTKALISKMFWAFYHEIAPGDFIIARRGRKMLAAVGTVSGSAFYALERNPNHAYANFMDVAWQEAPRDIGFPTVVFPMHTLAKITEAQYRSLVGTVVQPIPSEPLQGLEDPYAFGLEKYLEDFIVSNFDTIFKGELTIYKDDDGYDGQQYDTGEIGTIDILAVEPKSKSFVVIELKKGRSSDQVVGQVLRYMGWVKKNLCTSDQAVKGLVICKDADARLSYAIDVTSNIDVRYYSVSFSLRETP